MDFFHDDMRALQDRYEGRAVADRLETHRMRRRLNDDDRALIEAVPFFFLATASETSVDCSFKGGPPGFVKVVSDTELVWPDFDGNRMYRSLGNIQQTTRVGLLFLRFDGAAFDGLAARMRVNGRAQILEDDPRIAEIPGAKRLISVEVDHVFPNCPRYIPKLSFEEPSVYTPTAETTPPEPDWKSRDWVKDVFDAEADANK